MTPFCMTVPKSDYMVRVTSLFCLLAIGCFANETRLDKLPRLPRGEVLVLNNYAFAIDAYFKRTGKLPATLEEIRDYTDLTAGMTTSPDLMPFTERYALLPFPLDLPNQTRAAMVSLNTYAVFPFQRPHDEVRFFAAIGDIDGHFASGSLPESVIGPLLDQAGVVLKPIGGTISAPTNTRPRESEPFVPEALLRAMEMQERGELLAPKRADGEVWRDAKTASSTADNPQAQTPERSLSDQQASSSAESPRWAGWIVGGVAALLVIVLLWRSLKGRVRSGEISDN
jgi:hypothetical protein